MGNEKKYIADFDPTTSILSAVSNYDKHLKRIQTFANKPKPLTAEELLQFYNENKNRFGLKINYTEE